MSRRTFLGSAGAVVLAASALTAVVSGPADAASRSSMTVRALPGIVGTASPSATTGTSARDLVVAAVSPKKSGRPVVFYFRKSGKWVKHRTVKTNSAGEANLVGSNLSSLTWLAKTSSYKKARATSAQSSSTVRWGSRFNDDFDGNALDDTKWRHRYPNMWMPNRTCTFVDPDMVTVGSGRAVLKTKPFGTSQPFGLEGRKPSYPEFQKRCKDKSGKARVYRAAALDTSTKFEFTNGVAAARIKTSPLAGQHAAFWLPARAPGDTEIDIMESNGNHPGGNTKRSVQRALTAGIYYGKSSKVQKVVMDSYKTWSSKYHVFSVEWTPTQYIFRIDSRVVLRTTKGRSKQLHNVSLTNFVANWAISRNSGKESLYQVDWVKVWQKQ